MSDISERVQAEEKRIKLEEQLRQSQKMEAIGTLAGGIAHDFNNIMQGIMGYAELIMMNLSPGDRMYSELKNILKGAERAATLTQQLLAFSRQQMIRPLDISLNAVITGLSDMLRRVIGEHVELNLQPGFGSKTVHADPGALEHVLINLCINARDAMPYGGQITIGTENVVLDDAFCNAHAWAASGEYVLFSVTDTGTGMPPDVVARIFDPFFTTKETGKRYGARSVDGLRHCETT